MNLVINASEALGEKEGQIFVRSGEFTADKAYLSETYLAPDLEPGRYIYVEVQDTGCGMAPETQARVFDPFFTTKFTGRGLGLAAVLGIVRAHKGALKLNSELEKGTTFKILLPAAAHRPAVVVSRGRGESSWRGHGTILVVDDEQQVREIASRVLSIYGFKIVQAADGAEGLQKFIEQKGDIAAVLMDLTMPRLDGREAFQQIKAIDPEATVVLMSGYAEPERASGWLKEGWAGFLQKPFTPQEITGTMRRVLDSKKVTSQAAS
jgi:CheY-like chemotaxis protein